MKKAKFFTFLTALSAVSLPFCLASCKHDQKTCSHEDCELVTLACGTKGAVYKCNKCGQRFVGPIPEPAKLGLPILYLYGNFNKVNTETATRMSCTYINPFNEQKIESQDCTLKIQGNASVTYPKKNYNIKFYKKDTEEKEKFLLNDKWTKESKYTLKANYNGGHIRNIPCCKIVGSAIKENTSDNLYKLVNGGCADGFPIVIYVNDVFLGLFTLNIAKDKQLFQAKGEDFKPKAMLASKSPTANTSKLLEPVTSDFSDGIECEYYDEDVWTTEEVAASFNNLVNFGLTATDDEFKANISQYLNLERAIEYIALCQALYLPDNRVNNVMFSTYDGVVWTPTLYDLDLCLGRSYTQGFTDTEAKLNVTTDMNNILNRVASLYPTEIKNKYVSFRQTALSVDNIDKILDDFESSMPILCKDSDYARWTKSQLVKDTEDVTKIKLWIKEHLEWLDNNF